MVCDFLRGVTRFYLTFLLYVVTHPSLVMELLPSSHETSTRPDTLPSHYHFGRCAYFLPPYSSLLLCCSPPHSIIQMHDDDMIFCLQKTHDLLKYSGFIILGLDQEFIKQAARIVHGLFVPTAKRLFFFLLLLYPAQWAITFFQKQFKQGAQ